jgi:hypothetical protein
LASNPQLRLECERIRRSLEPLELLGDDLDPPAGLADRTLRAVDQYREACRPTPRSVLQASGHGIHATPQASLNASHRFYSISDAMVVALVGLAAITLFLPALANSRFEARKHACQNNMRLVGQMLIDDSLRDSEQQFVQVPLTGNRAFAGVYAPTLAQREMLAADSSALWCPGDIGSQGRAGRQLPTLEQIDAAQGQHLEQLQQAAGGSYAYCVGFVDENGRYRAVRNQGRSHFPLLSDAPSLHLEGRKSAHHGGRGQNILYEDGRINFVTDLRYFVGDDPLRNRQGFAERGCGQDDAVLLSSGQRPVIQEASEGSLTLADEPLR